MATHQRRPLTRIDSLIPLARTRIKEGLAITATLLVTTLFISVPASARQDSQAPPPPNLQTDSQTVASHAQPVPGTTSITVPAGSRIALVLTQPIQTRNLHRGDDIYAQVVSPVTTGNEVVIPPGTFVQGKIDKLERQGGRGELRLQSMSVTFPDGYTVPVPGPMTLESPDGYALKDPSSGRAGGAFALAGGGVGGGALIGHFAASSQPNAITSSLPPDCSGPPPSCLSSSATLPGSSAKDTIIGATVGGAIGGVAAIALLFNTHNFFLDVGSPVEMLLQHPLTLDQDQVATAVRQSEQHPVPEQPIAHRPQLLPLPDTGPVMLPPPMPPLGS
jgi:hypothetical protein